jgi:hypothetical protein
LTSKFPQFKIVKSGIITAVIPNDDYTVSVAHNLGFTPGFYSYYSVDQVTWMPGINFNFDIGSPNMDIYTDNTNLYIRFTNYFSWSSNLTIYTKYYVYGDKLN